MLEPIYMTMDIILGIFFHLTNNDRFNVMFGIFAVSAIVSGMIIYITSKFVDQKEMRDLKEKMAKFQKKAKKAQEKKNTKELARINRQMMEVQRKMFSKSMKPMLYTMVPIILIFSLLSQYGYVKSFIQVHGCVVSLPFILPIWGSELKWLGWYILCSFATSSLIKKILKTEI
jgi:uncharacterized membrane protein (DUF106 family)